MTKIGLISDTHSYLDLKVFEYFTDVDEIWHLGDVGDVEIISKLQNFKPLRGVYGNIDDINVKAEFKEIENFELEGLNIYMIHIGALPPSYTRSLKEKFKDLKVNLFLCGHSHILRVIKDKYIDNLVYINPGAAGKHGFHKVRTLMKMDLDNGKIKNMEVFELGNR